MTSVSIIIPVFNREDILHETLDSILLQRHEDWECLLVDDHSTDNTVGIMKGYQSRDPRFRVLIRPDSWPKGACSCRNYGFQESIAPLIQWFDSDDIMHPDFLLKKVHALEVNPESQFVVSRMANFEDDVRHTEPIDQTLTSEELILDFLRYRVAFLTPGPLFRKEYLSHYSLFNVRLKRHQEWEFFFRLILDLPEYTILDEVLAYRRMHAGSIRSKILEKDQTHRKKLHLISRLEGLKYLVRERNQRMTPDIAGYFRVMGKNAIYEALKMGKFPLLWPGIEFLYWLRRSGLRA